MAIICIRNYSKLYAGLQYYRCIWHALTWMFGEKVSFLLFMHLDLSHHRSNWQRPQIQFSKLSECIFKPFLNHFYCYSITVIPIFPLCPPPPVPLPAPSQFPHCFICLWVIHTCALSSPFPPLSPSPVPSGHFQSVPCFHAMFPVLFVSLFCSLGSSHRLDHMAFVFHHLAYFT